MLIAKDYKEFVSKKLNIMILKIVIEKIGIL